MRNNLPLAALLALPLFFTLAHAATIDTITISFPAQTIQYSFSLPAMPIPVVVQSNAFITGYTISGAGPSFFNEMFTTPSSGSSLDLLLIGPTDIPIYGPLLFTGLPSSPTLIAPGTYNVIDQANDAGTLTISQPSIASTPEPSTLILLGTGILALTGRARRKLSRFSH